MPKQLNNNYELLGMEQTGHRREYRRYNAPKLQIVRLCIYTALTLAGAWVLATYSSPGDNRYKNVVENAVKTPKPQGYGNGGQQSHSFSQVPFIHSFSEKIFIGAMFYNNEKIIPYWTERMVKVIRYLGTVRLNRFVKNVLTNDVRTMFSCPLSNRTAETRHLLF